MSTITDLIKALRGAGLSQSQISRRTGIPQPRLSRWEAGFAPDSVDDALKIKELYELYQLVGAEGLKSLPKKDA